MSEAPTTPPEETANDAAKGSDGDSGDSGDSGEMDRSDGLLGGGKVRPVGAQRGANRRVGTTLVLAALFVALIAAGTALRLWTTNRLERESQRLAVRWSAAEVNSLTQRVESQLKRAERVLRTLTRSPRVADPDMPPLERAEAMAAFLPGFDSFSFVYAGLPDGSSFGAQRLLSGRLEVFTRQPGAPGQLWAVKPGGELAKKQQVDPVPFDPRTTRWFQAAREAERVAWSQPYTGIGASSIVTASLAAPDAVFGVDVSLAGIADALAQGEAGTPRSSVFILNRDQNPILGLTRTVGRDHQVALDLFLRSSPSELSRMGTQSPAVRSFDSNGDRFVGAIRPLRLGESLLGAVVLLTPGEEVTPPLELSLIKQLGLGLILGGVAAGVAAMTSLGVSLGRALREALPSGEEGAAFEAGSGAAAADDALAERAELPGCLLACLRCGEQSKADRLRREAETAGFELAGQLPGRLLLRASEQADCHRLLDWSVERAARDGVAVGLAFEDSQQRVSAAELAEALAATPGLTQASEAFAQTLAADYAVRRCGRSWIGGAEGVDVCAIEAGA